MSSEHNKLMADLAHVVVQRDRLLREQEQTQIELDRLLTTENGISVQNEIHLDPYTAKALVRYLGARPKRNERK